MSAPLLVLGESLIDIVDRTGEEPVEHVGGSPANVAVGLARLGHEVELATWFGRDERGDRVRAHLERDGVSLAPGSDGAERTSTALARLDETGAADYEFDITCDLPDLAGRAPRLVHTGSISAVLEPAAARTARLLDAVAGTATVTYDPNARPAIMGSAAEARERVEALVARSDVVKVSDEDVAWLAPGEPVADVARAWLALGPAVVVVTRGGEGSEAYAADGLAVSVPAPRTTVVDTVGAGDSFMGGIIDALVRADLVGADRRERLRAVDAGTLRGVLERAAAIAAITVSRAGANPPTAAELA
ncbi:MAG TPA: carbohydrate kinase [Phototrophicaceae bacterium]|nr:carbohydrate kinase [Phototrophicaceae bacterium]